MKNKSIILLMLVAVGTFLFHSCKDDEPAGTGTTPNPNPTPTDTVVCSGNGSSSYYPLTQGSKWSYTSPSAGSPVLTIAGQNTYGGKNYTELTDATKKLYSTLTPMREDPATGDIYYYSTSEDKEYLEVPGSPTLDQSWARAGGTTRKVTNLSATLKTSKCNYTGLLEITRFVDTVANEKYYYKKGLGPVAIKTFTLTAVTLK